VFGMALQTLGYSVNTRKPKQIKAAYNKLLKLLPNVKLFNTNGDVPIYIDGDATVGMVESGDAVEAMSENKHLRFIYPKDGVLLWTDCMSIPKYAPHLKNAYKFINFIMQPKIAKMIAVTLGYSSPNAAAVKLMSKQEQDNPAIYPPKSVLKRAQIEGYLGKKTLNIYLHYWELLKLSS
jgi:spermidine/putrescine transport system substrate-binding protein